MFNFGAHGLWRFLQFAPYLLPRNLEFHNLSHTTLIPAQSRTLGLGLKFRPSLRPPTARIFDSGENKEVNKIYSCCVLLTSLCLKKNKKNKKNIGGVGERGAHGFHVKYASPKVKPYTFSTLRRLLIISRTLCGCFCSSHPFWNVICTITISYKISPNTILFKLPHEVCMFRRNR